MTLFHLADLDSAPRWVAWQTETRKGKQTKVPFGDRGFGAKTNDARTWLDRDHAERLRSVRAYEGIGIVLGPMDDGRLLCGLDLDSSLDEFGTLADWARPFLEAVPTYTEVSPSGRGLKLFFVCQETDARACLGALGLGAKDWGVKRSMVGNGAHHGPAVELYFALRYFTVTERQWSGSPDTIEEVDGIALAGLARLIPAATGKPRKANGGRPGAAGPVDDEAAQFLEPVDDAALRLKLNEALANILSLRTRWDGSTRGLNDTSRSAIDFSLTALFKIAGFSRAETRAALILNEHGAGRERAEADDLRYFIRAWNNSSDPPPPPPPPAPELGLPDTDLGWMAALQLNNKGVVLRTLANALVALRQAPAWAGVFGWDEFASRLMVLKPPPVLVPGSRPVPRELSETDLTGTTEWLQLAGIVVPSTVTLEAIRAIAEANAYHPVRDYLTGLHWDGLARLDLWLADHLGAEDTALNRAFGSKWMIGLVARVMRPGCQLDAALIMESGQGLGKSSVLRALTEPWFTDHMPDLTSKDAMQQIQGIWCVELAELVALRRADTHRIKSFISSRVDRFRPPFGRTPADHPRQCGFAGTVNPSNSGYLHDETGARRFWCVACGIDWAPDEEVDISALTAVRDQLWAEAVARFQAGEVWHLDTGELRDAQTEAAEDRQEDDPRERKIQEFLRGKLSVHMDEILGEHCLCISVERWTRALVTEIGRVIIQMKWRRRRVRDGKRLEWRYFPPRA